MKRLFYTLYTQFISIKLVQNVFAQYMNYVKISVRCCGDKYRHLDNLDDANDPFNVVREVTNSSEPDGF
jgi:hypothetical protein